MLPLALSVALAAQAAPDVPPQPILSDGTAAAFCPDRHAAELLFRLQTSTLKGAEQEAMRTRYDRAVAEWAVCARVMALPNWGVPDVQDPLARVLLAASLTVPGHRERIEGIELVADEMPFAAALLALEDLAVVSLLDRAEPQRRLELAAAAFGAWGCSASREWLESGDQVVGFCTDGRPLETMATSGLLRLAQIAAPTAQPPNTWLAQATEDRAREWWAAIGQTWFPLAEPPPLRVPEGGVGSPLEPGVGWSGRVGPDLVTWQERPAFRVTPTGIVVKQPAIRTRPPEAWDAAPVLYVDGETTLAALADTLARAAVARPVFVAQRKGSVDPRDLVELRLLWRADDAPPEGATVIRLGRLGGSLDRMRADAQGGAGPIWITAHRGARYRDLVAAHAALVGLRDAPVSVRLEPAP